MNLKRLSVFLLTFAVGCILWLYFKPSQKEASISGPAYVDLIIRLRTLDANFHQLVALTEEHESPPSEELDTAVETVIPKPKHFTRGDINESYYKSFLLKNNVQIPAGLKSKRKCNQDYNLLVLVQSYITHTSRRDSIRRTWGKSTTTNPKYTWKVIFIIGKTPDEKHPQLIAKEMSMNNDILLVSTGESFYNLTEKLQKSFQWITRYCSFQYLLKADDDVFVNIATLYNYLELDHVPKKGLFTGQVMWASEVYRKGRYAIDKGYNREFYPRYCSGGGYILSRDVVETFVELMKIIPYMRIDDAYFGELALKAGVGIIHNNQFRMWTANCEYTDAAIVTHPAKTDECMSDMFRKSSNAFALIGLKQ